MKTSTTPTYLHLPWEDSEGKLRHEYKVSPHGDADADRDAFFVDTRAEAKAAVAALITKQEVR